MIESIKDHVKGVSTFQSYRSGYFYYTTDTGLDFIIPREDIEGSTLSATEKSMFFMRWIRKCLQANSKMDSDLVLDK